MLGALRSRSKRDSRYYQDRSLHPHFRAHRKDPRLLYTGSQLNSKTRNRRDNRCYQDGSLDSNSGQSDTVNGVLD